jgi:predicted small secreted protein
LKQAEDFTAMDTSADTSTRRAQSIPSPKRASEPASSGTASLIVAGFSVVAFMLLAACHTTAGAGKDISAAGNAITNSAQQHTP